MKEAIIILSIESISIVFISPILELLRAGHALREDHNEFWICAQYLSSYTLIF